MGYVFAILNEFVKFIGGKAGVLHFLLFGAALLCCFIWGKRERKWFFWPSVLVMIFFFNPFFFKYVGTRFLSGIYWRLLWMLPESFVIAYVLTKLAYRFRRGAVRMMAVAAACLCIAITGEPIFSQTTYQEKENEYELPKAAIEICDYISGRMYDWKETVIVPNELLCSIRQYSAGVCLLYGRNAEGFIEDIGEEEKLVYDEMSKEEPDVELITQTALNKNCRFIVFNTSFHHIPEDLTEYGYEKLHVVEDVYVIYGRIDE